MPRGGKRPGAGRKRTKPSATPARRRARVVVAPDVAPVDTSEKANESAVAPPLENPHCLSPKELLFVECYTGVSQFNASDAYVRAGFKPNRHNASRLITKETVSSAIAERLGSRLRALQMDGDEALEGISNLGRSDPRRIFDEHGNIRPINTLDNETADWIQSIKVVERRIPDGKGGHEVEYVKEFKFYDKLQARTTMAKAAGRLIEKHMHRHVGPGGGPIRTQVIHTYTEGDEYADA